MTAASSHAMTLLDVLWRHSCSVAILIALVLVARSIAFRGPAARWRTALWVLVLARLLVPVVPSSRLSIANVGDWVTHARGAWQARQPAAAARIEAAPRLSSSEQIVRRGYLPSDALSVTVLLPAPAVEPSTWPLALAAAWVLGAGWVIARRVVSHASFVRRLKREPIITEGPLADLLARTCEQMGIRRQPALRLTTAVTTPALVGLVRPQLLIPPSTASSLAPAQLRLVLLHELAHLRRGDLWVDLLATLLVAAHWFNPFVWLAAALYRSDRELARDAMVLRAAGEAEAQTYGRTIVLLLEQLALNGPATPAGGVGILERWGGVRQRIQSVATFRRGGIARAAVALAAVAVVGCCGLTQRQRTSVAPTTAPAGGAAVAEATDESATVREWLARDVGDLSFDDMHLSDAIDALRKASGGANISVNWAALDAIGVKRDTIVYGRLHHVTLQKALRAELGDVRLDFAPRHDTIYISTADEIGNLIATTRTYDIHDLLVDIPDFTDAPTLGAVPSTSKPFAPASTQPGERVLSRAERVEAISKLVRETVDPNSWGRYGSIGDSSGQLVIRQTLENHEQIERLFEQLRETRGIQITLEARFFSVEPDAPDLGPRIEQILRLGGTMPPVSDSSKSYLAADDAAALLKELEGRKGVHQVAAPRMTVFNGQRAYVLVATQQSYVADLKVVHGGNGSVAYEPKLGVAESGYVFDAQATVSADRKWVTMTVRPQVSRVDRIEDVVFDRNALLGPDGHRPVIQRPIISASRMQTTVSIPDGSACVLGGFSPFAREDPGAPKATTAATGRPLRVFLLVRPRITVLHAPPPRSNTAR